MEPILKVSVIATSAGSKYFLGCCCGGVRDGSTHLYTQRLELVSRKLWREIAFAWIHKWGPLDRDEVGQKNSWRTPWRAALYKCSDAWRTDEMFTCQLSFRVLLEKASKNVIFADLSNAAAAGPPPSFLLSLDMLVLASLLNSSLEQRFYSHWQPDIGLTIRATMHEHMYNNDCKCYIYYWRIMCNT